ncbi:MAG TPA: anion transporter [Burkholderiales bacterium]|nr:anion transporter [Burkholderiales bacterium]
MLVEAAVLAVFFVVYLGMILGGLPFLQLDRTGVALLGAIALVSVGALTLEEAWGAIHAPTLILLFAFMVISAQLRLGGFYTWVTRRLGALPLAGPGLLAAMIAVIAALSAVFSNDIICLAVAPVLVDVCLARRLNPVPFLLALACAANVGSAATLIGNPQNMLIGETLRLPFLGYIREVAAPVALGLVLTWVIIAWQARGRWELAPGGGAAADHSHPPGDVPPSFDRWQSAKGVAVASIVFVLFLFAPLPREVVALVAAGLLMTSRRLHSFKMLGLVDWQLLVLFIGLFVVNHALARTGVPEHTIQDLAAAGVDLQHPGPLFAAAFVLSNIVSNVPAVMLLLPAATHEIAGPVLALSSTLAGNLLIVGSIANIIVVDAAQRRSIRIGWYEHARIGIPVTVATMTVAAGWLWLRLEAL